MSELQPMGANGFVVQRDQPLIGIPVCEDGEERVRYFTDEQPAEAAQDHVSIQRALGLLGAWKDIDTEDALDELDRIRHASRPTPPIDL